MLTANWRIPDRMQYNFTATLEEYKVVYPNGTFYRITKVDFDSV